MKQLLTFVLAFLLPLSAVAAPPPAPLLKMPAETLRDKIRGGLLGQMLGNLNGLEHEMKYIHEPGKVSGYVPALPEGAWTDDDTDFEWVYILEMQRRKTILLPPDAIAAMWKERINRRIWCSNQYARQLMEIGLTPPLTGQPTLNPWASFNISGQFLCETFALLAPGMPQTAAKIGLNYTTVAIDGEPAQTTQMFTTMIATAFVENDINTIIDNGVMATDPNCEIRQIAGFVRELYAKYPDDWQAARAEIKAKYTKHNGAVRDANGYELNTACTIAALLYGKGDLRDTLEMAFNLGWDCDNNAATAGTIIGVMKGHRWMMGQGWQIVDRYKNTTRDNMPTDETISSFADRLIDLAENVITTAGGRRANANGPPMYFIQVETPANILKLKSPDDALAALRKSQGDQIRKDLLHGSTEIDRARAAYLAICLDLAGELSSKHPAEWATAIQNLSGQWRVMQALFNHANTPSGDALRKKAIAAGLEKPAKKMQLWPGGF